jgi:hypothetical protein
VNQLTPLHAAALLRPGVDAIVLPSRPDVREFYGFVKATTGLQEGQVRLFPFKLCVGSNEAACTMFASVSKHALRMSCEASWDRSECLLQSCKRWQAAAVW